MIHNPKDRIGDVSLRASTDERDADIGLRADAIRVRIEGVCEAPAGIVPDRVRVGEDVLDVRIDGADRGGECHDN